MFAGGLREKVSALRGAVQVAQAVKGLLVCPGAPSTDHAPGRAELWGAGAASEMPRAGGKGMLQPHPQEQHLHIQSRANVSDRAMKGKNAKPLRELSLGNAFG